MSKVSVSMWAIHTLLLGTASLFLASHFEPTIYEVMTFFIAYVAIMSFPRGDK